MDIGSKILLVAAILIVVAGIAAASKVSFSEYKTVIQNVEKRLK